MKAESFHTYYICIISELLMSESRGTAKLLQEFGVVVFIPYLLRYALLRIVVHRTSRSPHD